MEELQTAVVESAKGLKDNKPLLSQGVKDAIPLVFTVAVLLVLTVLTATTQFAHPGDYVMYVLKVLRGALTFPYMFYSPLVLLAMVVLANNVEQRWPRLDIGIPDLWRKTKREKQNAFITLTQHPKFGLSYTFFLIITTPILASYEEFLFRDQAGASEWPLVGVVVSWMPEIVFIVFWSVIAFGLVHIFSGVSLAEAIVLSFGGLYFAIVYRYSGGVASAIVAHTSYNIWAIGFLTAPDFRALTSDWLITAGKALKPKTN